MENSLTNLGYFLNEYKIGEDDKKIIFEIPIEIHLDLYKNKDFLHKQFENVTVELIYPRTTTQVVTCYKKHI